MFGHFVQKSFTTYTPGLDPIKKISRLNYANLVWSALIGCFNFSTQSECSTIRALIYAGYFRYRSGPESHFMSIIAL